jgi:hypothetical protein
MIGEILVGIAVGVVTLVLMAGLYTLWMGGETSRNWSNKLMRVRILAQLVAVILIMAVLWLRSG